MPNFEISMSEWQTANAHLVDKKSTCLKLYRSDKEKNQKIIKQGYPALTPYDTKHSFIKIGYYLLALNPKLKKFDDYELQKQYNLENVAIGEGSYGNVKYAVTQDGNIYAVKIQHQYSGSADAKELSSNARDTFWTGFDVELNYSYAYRHNNKHDTKAYTVMRYLGSSLGDYLDYGLKDSERFNIAANMCFQVHKYHRGLASKTSVKYAHGDIKPSNFTIDKLGRVSLVDVDMVNQGLDDKPINLGGTCAYWPKDPFSTTQEKLDCLALKRSLYYPEQAVHYVKSSYKKQKPYNYPAVFTLKLLESSCLAKYIDTTSNKTDFIDDYISALDLTVLISLASISLIDKFEAIKTESQKYAIAVLMQAEILNAQNVNEIITNKNQLNNMAKLAPIVDRVPKVLLQLSLKNEALLNKLISLANVPPLKRRDQIENFVNAYLAKSEDVMNLMKRPIYLNIDEIKERFKLAFETSDVNLINKQNLLSYAVVYELHDELSLALLLGANPNQKDAEGYTPSMLAIIANQKQSISLLLNSKNTDLTITQTGGFNSYDFAEGYLCNKPSFMLFIEENFKHSEEIKHNILKINYLNIRSKRTLGQDYKFSNNMLIGNPANRHFMPISSIALDWISDVCDMFKFSSATYFKTANLFYQIMNLKAETILRQDIQKYLSACCILSEFLTKEPVPEGIFNDFAYVTASAYTDVEISKCLLEILEMLEYDFYKYKSAYDFYQNYYQKKFTFQKDKEFTAYLTFISFDYRFLEFDNEILLKALNQSLHTNNDSSMILSVIEKNQFEKCLTMIEKIKQLQFDFKKISETKKDHVNLKKFSIDETIRKKYIKESCKELSDLVSKEALTKPTVDNFQNSTPVHSHTFFKSNTNKDSYNKTKPSSRCLIL